MIWSISVGSYVTSYLNTKRSSSYPSSKPLQHLLRKYSIPDRFANMDSLRFSKYREMGSFDSEVTQSSTFATTLASIRLPGKNNVCSRIMAVILTLQLYSVQKAIYREKQT